MKPGGRDAEKGRDEETDAEESGREADGAGLWQVVGRVLTMPILIDGNGFWREFAIGDLVQRSADEVVVAGGNAWSRMPFTRTDERVRGRSVFRSDAPAIGPLACRCGRPDLHQPKGWSKGDPAR